jgi:hypothetical protein
VEQSEASIETDNRVRECEVVTEVTETTDGMKEGTTQRLALRYETTMRSVVTCTAESGPYRCSKVASPFGDSPGPKL